MSSHLDEIKLLSSGQPNNPGLVNLYVTNIDWDLKP